MTDIRIFKMDGGGATELKGSSVALEKSLQTPPIEILSGTAG